MNPIPRIIPALLVAVAIVACSEDSTSPSPGRQGSFSRGVSAAASYSLPILLPLLPGTTQSEALAVNDLGTIVGHSWGTALGRAVKWVGTTVTDLGLPKSEAGGVARDINSGGTIVGEAWDDQGNHGVRWSATQASALPNLPGAKYGSAFAINDAGIIVGVSLLKANHAVRWNPNGTLTDLHPPAGAYSSWAHDINNSGYIVGSVRTDNQPFSRPFLWYPGGGGTFLSTEYGAAHGINDSMVVTGEAINPATGLRSAFTWTPTGGVHFIPGVNEGSGWKISSTGRVAGALSDSLPVAFTAPFNLSAQQLTGHRGAGYGINRCGAVVGSTQPTGTLYRATKWSPRVCEA